MPASRPAVVTSIRESPLGCFQKPLLLASLLHGSVCMISGSGKHSTCQQAQGILLALPLTLHPALSWALQVCLLQGLHAVGQG